MKFGLVTFQSGPYSAFGDDIVAATKMLVNNWNEQGGLQGQEIQLSTRDTEGDAQKAIQEARELVESEGIDIMGCFLSTPEARAAMNVAGRNQTPLITCSTGARLLVEQACNPYAFRGPTSTLAKAKAGGPTGVEEFGSNVFQLNPDYSWGKEIKQDWQTVIEDNGGSVVDSMYVELGASDFSTAISRIQSADPDWIQVGFAGSGAVSFMTQANQQGLEYPQFHHVLYEQTVSGASGDIFNTVPVYTPTEYTYQIDTGANNQFVEAFNSEFGRNPSLAAGNAYRHLDAGFKGMDGADSLEADALVSAFEGWSGSVITGDYTIRACDHQGEYPVYIAQVDQVSSEGAVSWNVQGTVASDQILLSCEEQTSRLECDLGE
ncbi:ABC transporter substrate-binding protein [Halomarina litorea]|uniref:ABC transporter substrate-binding protein n=1 Tax=Halomarina litorea TaxID=2961595 RepID=UPI0020C2A82D|nr:ABC transporter substrate-binding protein [Halomarina sp. BCD28]